MSDEKKSTTEKKTDDKSPKKESEKKVAKDDSPGGRRRDIRSSAIERREQQKSGGFDFDPSKIKLGKAEKSPTLVFDAGKHSYTPDPGGKSVTGKYATASLSFPLGGKRKK